MNYRAIVYYIGTVLKLESVFLLLPLVVSICFGELDAVKGLGLTSAVTMGAGLLIDLARRDGGPGRAIYVKDGLILTALCWLTISLFGALPFYLSGAVPSFLDCLFESVAGFTTTGSTILQAVERMPKGLLLWRSLSQWIGGMGVLVFLLAVASNAKGEHSVHVLKAEAPGPAPGKLVPRLRQSAKILYIIYLALTLAQAVLLIIGGMPVFDSVCYAMATAGTGGFELSSGSLAVYDSAYIELVIGVFMILFGLNFNVYYFILVRNWSAVLRSSEVKGYFTVLAGSSLLIAGNLFFSGYGSVPHVLRLALFQSGSIMTTTAFAAADYALWPTFSRVILMILMTVGACSGSTAGGLKVSRVMILIREARRMFTRRAHPRAVRIVRMDGKAVDKTVVHGVTVYVLTFLLIAVVSVLLVSLDGLDFETTFSAVIASVSNVGPGLGLVAPSGSFSVLSPLSKVVLMLDMLIGRLEIYPILLLFAPQTWRRI